MEVAKTKPTQTIPGTTGQQMAPVGLLGEPMAKTIGDAGIEVSAALSEADQRNQRRQNLLRRTSDEKIFNTTVAQEWQRVQDQDDLTDEATFQKFNKFVTDQKTNIMMAHRGTGDSPALLESKLTQFAGNYEIAAISSARTATIDALTANYSELTSPLLAKVASGEMTETEAINELNTLTIGPDTVGEALPSKLAIDLADATQSQIIITGLERDLSKGTRAGIEAAQLKLRQNPSFAAIMTPLQLKNVTKRMADQEYALNAADVQYGAARERFAVESGYKNYNSLPAPLKQFYASGGKIEPPKPYEMQSPEGKIASDRAYLVASSNNDPNDPRLKAFDEIVAQKNQKEATTKVGKLNQDRKRLIAAGTSEQSPEIKAIDAQILNENPEYVALQDKVLKYTPALNAFDNFNRQALSLHTDAKKALMLLTNEKTYKAATEAAADKDFNWTLTGVTGAVSGIYAGSDFNELQSILTRISGKAMLDALSSLKAASPTGASGMGALNQTEGDALRFQEGALSIKAPQTTAATLMSLIDNTDSVITSQENAFKTAFPEINKDFKAKFAPKEEEVGTIGYDIDGNPL